VYNPRDCRKFYRNYDRENRGKCRRVRDVYTDHERRRTRPLRRSSNLTIPKKLTSLDDHHGRYSRRVCIRTFGDVNRVRYLSAYVFPSRDGESSTRKTGLAENRRANVRDKYYLGGRLPFPPNVCRSVNATKPISFSLELNPSTAPTSALRYYTEWNDSSRAHIYMYIYTRLYAYNY